MAEILTESFCERCGTRYTFQTAAPRRGRLARLRVASKGLRNYVLEDGSSLEDAFTEARNEEERAISGQQLEAFHKTFNFCLSCRQYTCANCWNEPENRCLSCAPDLSREVMPAPLPDLQAVAPIDLTARAGLAELAWPEADLGKPEDGHAAELAAAAAGAAIIAEGDGATPEVTIASPAGALGEASEPVVAEPEPVVAEPEPVVAEPEPAVAEPEPAEPRVAAAAATPLAPEAPVVPAIVEPAAGPETRVAAPASAAPGGPTVDGGLAAAAALSAAEAGEASPSDPDARARKAAARTALLLGRFRPGQSLDAAIDAYERGEPIPVPEEAAPAAAAALAAAAAMPDQVARIEPATTPSAPVAPAVETAAASPVEPAGEVAAAAPPVRPAPEPEPELAPAPAPAPAPMPSAEPVPPRRDDRVELPVWTIMAPDAQPSLPGETPAWPPVVPPQVMTPPPAGGAPAWPTAAWATPQAPMTAMRAREAMWAESSREVGGAAVQSCVSCGLPLSATARFCRRCGTRQGG